MPTGPQPEHRWLDKLVGEWTLETSMQAGPDKPVETFAGSETVRSLDGLWVVAEARWRGQSPGGEATTLMALGYDPDRRRYVGTWLGSMMSHLWVYEGNVDAGGRVLRLDSAGPRMDGKEGTAKYQDVITFIDDDRRTLTGRILGDDGQWSEINVVHYRRKR